MNEHAWKEQAARIIDPASWAVMDSYLKQMLRKYKGQNIGYDPEAFKHKESMAIAAALWPLVQQAIAQLRDRVAALEEGLDWYGKTFCELGSSHECCGRLQTDDCSGCKARALLTQNEVG